MDMEIEKLVENYVADDNGIKIARESRILILVGIMSAGKDAIKDDLLKRPEYSLILTHTTRPPRENNGKLEKDGVEYRFVSIGEMTELVKQHQMVEVNHFGDNYYGTSVNELHHTSYEGDIAVGNLDINGYLSFSRIAPESVTGVFIVPPDYNTWIERVKGRYGNLDQFNKEWESRRSITIAELEKALNITNLFFIINDDLKSAVELVDKIANHDENTLKLGDAEARACASRLLENIKNNHN